MPTLTLTRPDLPFLLDGAGSLDVDASVPDLTRPIDPTDADLFTLRFAGEGGRPFAFGAADTASFGVKAGTEARLVALWPSSDPDRLAPLAALGLESYFADHPNDLILVLTLGASAGADLAASFQYSALTAGATLDGSADAAFAMARPYRAARPAGEIITDFFEHLRLPANVSAAPGAGEAVALEYGGYLSLGASAGVGYRLSGTQSFEIGGLAFGESYTLGVLASLGLTARVAGRFRVEVGAGSEPSWARVTVRKSDAKAFTLAADVSASAALESHDLPGTPRDFVTAIFGLRANTWLNLFDQARDATDFATLRARLDTLARSFVERFVGRTFDEIAATTPFDELANRLAAVARAADGAGARVVSLFDRYFDAEAGKISSALESALGAVRDAISLDRFTGAVDPVLWDVLAELTGGDPLGLLAGEAGAATLDDVKQRADAALDALHAAADNGLLRVIELAHAEFHLDALEKAVGGKTWDQLVADADERAVGFVERLLGTALDAVGASDGAKALAKAHELLEKADDFAKTAYARFEEALGGTYQLEIHAAYSRTRARDALIDCELDLSTADGKRLMRAAGQGDFSEVLAGIASPSVKILSGALARSTTKRTDLTVDVLGWRDGWHYASFESLIASTEQHIMADANGLVTITTTIGLDVESQVNRNGERVYTNLLLSFVGVSRGAVTYDARHQEYLVDAITGMGASYRLVHESPDASEDDLRSYLAPAHAFGITDSDAGAFDAFAPTLPRAANGRFGKVTVTYDVRFTREGLAALFGTLVTSDAAAAMHEQIRTIVLADYVHHGRHLADRAWAFATPQVYRRWKTLGSSFMTTTNPAGPQFDVRKDSPLPLLDPPARVTMSPSELVHLNTLFSIEDSLVVGLIKLTKLVRPSAGGALGPSQFEHELSDFGSALNAYQSLSEGKNALFALFDYLVRTAAGDAPRRTAGLTLEATLGTETVTKILVA